MKKLRLILLVIVMALSAMPLGRALGAGSEADIAFNKYLETRLREIVVELTGIEKVIVVVNADLDLKAKDRNAVLRPRPSQEQRRKEALSEENKESLPGVPVKKEYGKETAQAEHRDNLAPIMPDFITSGASVQKMAVSILIDKAPEEQVKQIKDVVSTVIAYNPARGDVLEVKSMDFKKKDSKLYDFLKTPYFYWFMVILLGMLFLILIGLFFMGLLKTVTSALTNVNLTVSRPSGGGLLNVGGDYAVDQGSGHIAGGEQTKLLSGGETAEGAEGAKAQMLIPHGTFSFIDEKNLADVAYLIQELDIPDIALVLNYLNQEIATKLLDMFPIELQAQVALSLSEIREVDPERVRGIEESMKARLNFIVRGEDKAASILGLANDEVRERVLALMQGKDASAAARLKAMVKSFEEIIMEIPLETIQELFRQVDVTLFAQVLKTETEEIRMRVLGCLTAGAAERLLEEIELSSALPPARLRKEKLHILSQIRSIIEMGAGEGR